MFYKVITKVFKCIHKIIEFYDKNRHNEVFPSARKEKVNKEFFVCLSFAMLPEQGKFVRNSDIIIKKASSLIGVKLSIINQDNLSLKVLLLCYNQLNIQHTKKIQ